MTTSNILLLALVGYLLAGVATLLFALRGGRITYRELSRVLAPTWGRWLPRKNRETYSYYALAPTVLLLWPAIQFEFLKQLLPYRKEARAATGVTFSWWTLSTGVVTAITWFLMLWNLHAQRQETRKQVQSTQRAEQFSLHIVSALLQHDSILIEQNRILRGITPCDEE